MSKMTVEELKQTIPDKKFKKMVKRSRGRFIKNLCIWLAGFLFLPVVLVAAVGIAVGIVPIKTYFGKNASEYVDVSSSGSIGNQTAFIIGKKIFDESVGDYKIKDIPVLDKALQELFNGTGLSEYITVDLNAISDLSLDNISGLTDSILSCFTISEKVLGEELGESELFSVSEAGKTAGAAKAEENFNAKLYYYDASASAVAPFSAKAAKSADNSTYKRAFTDNGEFVDGVTAETPLYYPSLSMVPLGEATDVLVDRIKQIQLTDVLSVFTDKNDETGMIFDLLGDKTIETISDLSLEDIKLAVFFETPDKNSENKQLYDILLDITGFTKDSESSESEEDQRKAAYENLSLDSFNGINVNNIRISTIIKEEDSKTLFSLLKDMSGKTEANEITISDLTSDNSVNNIKLTSVLDDKDNEKLYDLLRSATGETENDKITIGKLSEGIYVENVKLSSVLDLPTKENGYKNQEIYDILVAAIPGDKGAADISINDFGTFNVSNIPLSVVLDLPTKDNSNKNKLIYDILVAATEADSAENITINSLSSFNADNIKLSTVLPNNETNKTIYDILVAATGADRAEDITINSLSNFDANKIKLSTVLPIGSNGKIYSILSQATGKDADEILISSLSNFNVGNITLTTVIDKNENNEKLFSILKDVTGCEDEKDIKLSDLSSFNVSNIKLNGLITAGDDNKILSALLNSDGLTLGNIGEKINELKLSDMYTVECFEEKTDGKYYKLKNGGYVIKDSYQETTHGEREGDKQYDISSSASIWLFMFYDYETEENFDSDGNCQYYTESGLTLSGLESMSNIAGKLENATIRQLVDSGVLSDPEYSVPQFYAMSLTTILGMVSLS